MLTATQLRTATTTELEQLQARVQKELESRITPDLERHKQDQRSGTDQRVSSGHTGHYQWEYVQCGHKDRCKRCQSGKNHGPYLYRYFYRDGKQKSQYIKLSELLLHPDAPPRPIHP